MSPLTIYKIEKFVISTLWNVGGMSLAFILDAVGKNLGLFNLSPEVVAFVGIILSRTTKIINIYFQEKAQDARIG
jgi:hypothetical protein